MRSKQERLEAVRTMRGTCYWPTWARGPIDNWTSEADPAQLRRELGYVAELGFNAVRLWNSAWGYEKDPAVYVANLTLAFDICSELGLDVDLVLFDSCGTDPEIGEIVVRKVEDLKDSAWDHMFMRHARAQDERVDIFSAPAIVRVPDRGDPMAVVWEGWVPNPGYYWLGEEHRPRWKAFADGLLTALKDHPALVLVEVMNEPFVTHIGQEIDRQPIRDFYTDMYHHVAPQLPDVPITMGAESLVSFKVYESDLGQPLDVVSFHPLTYSPAAFEKVMAEAKSYADESGRPALGSEWGNFPGCADEIQLELYKAELPLALASGVGWCQSHMMVGYGPFALTALVYPNGTMRPAAVYLRDTLKG